MIRHVPSMTGTKVPTCDWCSRKTPVQEIGERLWRFWKTISDEDPTIASLRNICENCRSRYEGFSSYVERYKSNESIIDEVLSPGKIKEEPVVDVDQPHRSIIKEEVVEPTAPSMEKTVCLRCNKHFSCAATLKAHGRIHTGDRPFECSYCDKSFSDSSNLRTHFRIHIGDRPYKCPRCEKRYLFPSQVKEHMRSHGGDKPYKCGPGHTFRRCSRCDKCYLFPREPRDSSRGRPDDGPFVCLDCDRGSACSSTSHGQLRTY